MSRLQPISFFIVISAIIAIVWFAFYDTGSTEEKGATKAERRFPAPQKPHYSLMQPCKNPDRQFQNLVGSIRHRYAENIFHATIQLRFIQELRRYLAAEYPDNDRTGLFEEIVRAAFPDHADEIVDLANNLNLYYTWLHDNNEYLAVLPNPEKDETLWNKRRELFGEHAEIIWAAERKRRIISRCLQQIAQSEDTPIREKLDMYLAALHEAHDDNADDVIKQKQQALVRSFLRVETIQDDLQQMNEPERREMIRSCRKSFGMTQHEIMLAEKIDRVKDLDWNGGNSYMAARENIISSHEGPGREQKLDTLRTARFGPRADIIEREEKAGHYRFKQTRLYGIN